MYYFHKLRHCREAAAKIGPRLAEEIFARQKLFVLGDHVFKNLARC